MKWLWVKDLKPQTTASLEHVSDRSSTVHVRWSPFLGVPVLTHSQSVCTLPGHDTFTCPNRIQWNKCQRKNLSLGFETKACAAVHVKNCKKKSACRDHPTSQAQHVSKLCFTSHVLHHLTKPLRKEKEHKSVRLYRH